MQHGQSAGDANATRQGFVRTAVIRLFSLLVSAQKKHRDRNSIRHLDDRLLRDIGLHRADVEHYVSVPVNTDKHPRGF
ncbi:DUF1127 domain-containing protein [Thalassospira sp. TSL5-1]|uniref:DUF1127 domain-containing protein n=1 Tax=Thalassospira sp. TSL5-1 TaxID=1544451 RepID=UPI00093B94A0|nr:hypothetical protein LF95_07175 [Thalassospira sp. TSL5-1]